MNRLQILVYTVFGGHNMMNKLRFMSLLLILLGVRNGFLALWEYDDPQPVRIYPIAVSSLPASAQEELSKGIELRDGNALAEILKEYLR